MIRYLSTITESIIQVRKTNSMVSIALPPPPMEKFIKHLCINSNVQTPTLMATTVYLEKLKNIIPSNVYGIESTRHRIFLGCLVLAAKTLNDSSPLNKHWAKYTDNLLQLREINTIERELLEYFDWNIKITTNELIGSLSYFIQPIKQKILSEKLQQQSLLYFSPPTTGQLRDYIYSKDSSHHSRSSSDTSLPSLSSSVTDSSKSRSPVNNHQYTNIHVINEEAPLENSYIKNIHPFMTKNYKNSNSINIDSKLPNPASQSKVTIKRSAAWQSFF